MNAEDDIIEKLKRIVRLARRAATDGERVAAENAARRLASKAGVSLDSLEVADSDIKTERFVDENWITHPGCELGFLTGVMRQHFGIVIVQTSRPGSRKVRLSWIGTKINVEVAKHCFVFLLRECRRAWAEARVAKGLARGIRYTCDPARQRQLVALRRLDKQSFMNGWFFVIHKKLTEHPLRNDLEQFEAERRDMEDFLKRMEGVRDESGTKTARADSLSITLGIESARDINLNRPCGDGEYRGRPGELGISRALEIGTRP